MPMIFPSLPDLSETAPPAAVHGWNRAQGSALIDAQDDVSAVMIWLNEFRHSPHTLANYRKEAERFLLWASHWRGKTLSALKREDVHAYDEFMRAPDPNWCGPTRPRAHPEWRPFTRQQGLSASSRQLAHTTLSALFRYLIAAGYLQRNPFALQRRRKPTTVTPPDRFLSQDAIAFLFASLPHATSSAREAAQTERARWILTLLYQSALRLREICQGKMGDFYLLRGNWWLRVCGKGGSLADVPVSDALLAALQRYRRHLGLPAIPAVDESTPLVASLWTSTAPRALSPAGLHKVIKSLLQNAATAAIGAQKPDLAQQYQVASAHWFRHSAASHQLDAGVPLLVVSQNLRHAQLETTRRYLHSEADQRHAHSRQWSDLMPK